MVFEWRGCDIITEIERNCMRCQEEVTIDFQESVSQSGKPILIGKCPECDGVNIQRLPSEISQKESSEVENLEGGVESPEEVSEPLSENREGNLISLDESSEESENSPSQVSPSDSSVQIGDILHAYNQGYDDGRENMSSGTTKESENDEQDITSLEGESEPGVGIEQEDAGESEEESDTTEKGSGLDIFMGLLGIVSLIFIGVMWYLSSKK